MAAAFTVEAAGLAPVAGLAVAGAAGLAGVAGAWAIIELPKNEMSPSAPASAVRERCRFRIGNASRMSKSYYTSLGGARISSACPRAAGLAACVPDRFVIRGV
jgi:hypothetical protein